MLVFFLLSCIFSAPSIQIIHNSASPTVDIYIGNCSDPTFSTQEACDNNDPDAEWETELIVESFKYRQATEDLNVPLDFIVYVAPSGFDSNGDDVVDYQDAITEFPFILDDNKDYIVVATGLLNDSK